jgi:hypothetical protein
VKRIKAKSIIAHPSTQRPFLPPNDNPTSACSPCPALAAVVALEALVAQLAVLERQLAGDEHQIADGDERNVIRPGAGPGCESGDARMESLICEDDP